MKHDTRLAAAALAALLGLTWALAPAAAESPNDYPSRPIKVIVPNPPGGATDTTARLVGQKVGELLGQTVVIENRPGSGGQVASEVAASASPDGYTIMLGQDSQFVINPFLYKTSPVDPMKAFVPVASLVTTVMILTVNPKLPVKDFHGFIDYARHSNPPLLYGSIGNGSQHHLAMEMLKRRAGIALVHVPYKGGGPAAQALVANEVAAEFGGNSTARLIKQGLLRGLAVASLQRSPDYPDLPAIAETYPGYEVTPWLGFFAPAGVPGAILAKLHDEVNRALADPKVAGRLHSGGMYPFLSTPAQFQAFIKADYVKYGEIVKAIGVKIE
jgi:tripartite-type tricarboxylate transporter receptor subunit TctC